MRRGKAQAFVEGVSSHSGESIDLEQFNLVPKAAFPLLKRSGRLGLSNYSAESGEVVRTAASSAR